MTQAIAAQTLTPSNDQSLTKGRDDLLAGGVGRYLGACGQLFGSIVPPLMTAMFDRLDEVLRDLADKAEEGSVRGSYLNAGRILRQQHRDIQINFFRMLRQGATPALNPPPPPVPRPDGDQPHSEPDSQELMVPQGAELAERLVIGNLTTKAEARYRPELLEMRVHLGQLLGRGRLPERSNPYGPFAVCDAFRRALVLAYQLEPPFRLVVYKLFDRHLMDRLGDFYKGCIDLAAADGHVPGSGFAQVLGGAGQTGAVRSASPGVFGPAGPLTSTLPFEVLQGLLALQRPGASMPKGGNRVRAADLYRALSEQKEVPFPGAVREEPRYRGPSDPLSALGAGTGALSRDDEDTLELVSLFFEHLLQGTDLPVLIKVLLGRLQTPVAKLALLDKTFFSDAGHPARRLVNRTGQAAMGWNEDDDRGPESLYGMIERVVERLVLDFEGDTALFAQMDRYLAAFIDREQASARAMEVRLVAQRGPPAPESGQLVVANLVEDYLARFPSVPPVIESILRDGWEPAMLAVYRSSGSDSAAWRRGLELADRLLWSAQPKLDAEDRRQLLRRIPEILRGLRAQLGGSGVDQRQLARWFRDLQTLHLGVLQGEPGPLPSRLPPGPKGVPTDAPSVGSWVEFQRADGPWVRFKVAWVSADGARQLFVDRRGRRGPDLGHGELRALLERGLVRILSDGQEPIVDRALRSVLAGLAG